MGRGIESVTSGGAVLVAVAEISGISRLVDDGQVGKSVRGGPGLAGSGGFRSGSFEHRSGSAPAVVLA
jgi:hypothetical protein